MNSAFIFISAIVSAYLIGSLPTGYCLARWLKNIDIRQHGSGNVGATNVFRTVGRKAGIATLLIDFLKGFLPVYFFAQTGLFDLWQLYILGVACIAGHNWTIFLNFKGGKGVITSAGVFTALLLKPLLVASAVFIVVFGFSRRVSAGSISAALVFPFSVWFMTQTLLSTCIAIVCAAVLIFLHRANIQRLLSGTEAPVQWRKK